MKISPPSVCRRFGAAFLVPSALLVVAAGVIATGLQEPARLAASTFTPSVDPDGDHLVERQEKILDTSPLLADSDQDGYGDSEELARASSPIHPESLPEGGLHLGMSARAERNGLHALIAVYLPDHDIDALNLRIGMLVGRRVRQFPQSLLAYGSIEYVPAADPNALVALIDVPFSRNLLDVTGQLSLFATATSVGNSTVVAAAAIHLHLVDDVAVLTIPLPNILKPEPLNIGGGGGGGPGGGGIISKPLTESGDAPMGWEPGEVCHQTSQPVSVNGPIVVNEVTSAGCEGGWEGACPPDCSSSTGSSYSTVDPAILIGG